MDITDRTAIAKALAKTYEGGYHDDPWELVEQHRRVMEYTAEHPQKGSSAVANALNVPRSRIRPWMESDSKPDPVRAVEIAEANDWLDFSFGEPSFNALNVLVAWIFASGSITVDIYRPGFIVDNPQQEHCLQNSFSTVGITEVRRTRTKTRKRATEIFPTQHASVLGRLLYVLGAPVGTKHSERDFSLPEYLTDAPWDTKFEWARTFVWLRSTAVENGSELTIQIREERSESYQTEMRGFLNSLVPDATRGESATYRFSDSAGQLLFQKPRLCEE
jgi:hypothetical protein